MNMSARQETIVKFLTRGFTNKEIAKEIGVSPETVKVYLCRLYKKTGIHSRRAIARKYEAERGA